MTAPAPAVTSFSTQCAPTLTSSPSATSPSNTQPTSMRTSRPQASLPRRSNRSGSAIDVPASQQRVRLPALDDALDRRELRAVVDALHVLFAGGEVRGDRHAGGRAPCSTTSVR